MSPRGSRALLFDRHGQDDDSADVQWMDGSECVVHSSGSLNTAPAQRQNGCF